MKIIAVSDLHGNLIRIKESCDVFIIAGDWSPLYCQHDYSRMLEWINKKFVKWMLNLNAAHIIFIPGNHDLVCTYSCFSSDLLTILNRYNCIGKIHYLNCNSIILNDVKFFGLPNSESHRGWDFSNPYNMDYKFDHDTDILITHQPPKVGDVGYVRLFNKEFGSEYLRNEIVKSNIRLNICGHIHTGSHEVHTLLLNNGHTAEIRNVSILNEDYMVEYKPTAIEL